MPQSPFRSSLTALALAVNFSVHLASAADDALNPPIATVDMKQIFATHPQTKEAESQINAERNTTKRALDDAEAKLSQLKTGIKELDTDLATGKLGDTAREQTTTLRTEKVAQTQILEAQTRALRDETTRELQRSSLRMRNAILDAINADLARTPELATATLLLVGIIKMQVQSTAVKSGCHLIFDTGGSSLNGVPYVKPLKALADLTEEVILALSAPAP